MMIMMSIWVSKLASKGLMYTLQDLNNPRARRLENRIIPEKRREEKEKKNAWQG